MISMITNRRDLYQRLWEEYFPLPNKEKHNSFFYKYLKRKKDERAARIAESTAALAEYSSRKKPDKYISLRSAYLAYKNGILTEKEYIDCFTGLTGGKSKISLNTEHEALTPALIDQAELSYENIFLSKCISDFFYNMGFRLRKTADEEKNEDISIIGYTKLNERYLKENDGYIDDLDIWANYYIFALKDEAQPPKFVSDLTEEYIEKCRNLFSMLNTENRDKTFLPLYFDPGSGAGVIIVGNNILPEEKQCDKSCRICISYFSTTVSEINEYGEFDITMMSELYDDVNEAFDRFKRGISTQEYIENYSDQNNELPEGIDSIFHCYFYEKQERTSSYDNIIQKYNRMEQIGYQKNMKEKARHNKRINKA